MSERMQWEKSGQADEKTEEKTEEKRREKEEEKGRGEKWHHNPVGAVVWAAILIWAGVVLLAESLGLTRMLGPLPVLPASSAIAAGAGLIIICGAVFRLLVPEYRRPVTGAVVLGVVLIAIGLGEAVGYDVVGPLALVAVGAFILLRALAVRR